MNIEYSVQQLTMILNDYEVFQTKSKYSDLSDLPQKDIQGLATKATAAVHRISGDKSVYSIEIKSLVEIHRYLHAYIILIMGVVQALRDDLKSGYICSLVEIIHADMFGDFLEMAQHLCDSGYKDAAIVIAGSALESHLRNLCYKENISTEMDIADSKKRHKKAEAINTELAANTVYSKLDQKNITAWLDLRNKAAHGKYTEYTHEQAKLLISSVQDFITRIPA